jgi:CRP-like cAMP-binding protein
MIRPVGNVAISRQKGYAILAQPNRVTLSENNMTRSSNAAAAFAPRLDRFCNKANFRAGDVIRRKGKFYKDMYLIVGGLLDVHLEVDRAPVIEVGPGSPIGEIGYLRGCRATGTVVARTDASAIVIDDGTLKKI